MRTTRFCFGLSALLIASAIGCQSPATSQPSKPEAVASSTPEAAPEPKPVPPVVIEEKQPAEPPHNPFGLEEIPDPDGPAVQALAAQVRLTGDARDANAEQWVRQPTTGMPGSVNGEWSERWRGGANKPWSNGKGATRIKAVGNRVYFLVNSSNGRFLIDTKRDRNRLAGKYRGIDNPLDTGPCVFLIVNDERIDGVWAGAGRWDFRRKLKGGELASARKF